MENLLSIGSKVDKDTSDNITESLNSIMKTAFETRASDEVLLKALDTLNAVLSVNSVNIQNCVFDATKKNIVDITVQDEIEVNKEEK